MADPKNPGQMKNDELENNDQKKESNLNGVNMAFADPNKPQEKQDKANEADVSKANDFVTKQSKMVHQSKYTKLNYMTIPQIQAGKDILQKKLADPNVPAATKTKLKDMYAEYEKTEAKINRYYRAIETNPLTRGFVRGQRNLLTIAQIRAQANKGVWDKDSNGFIRGSRALADWMRAVNFDKIALGTGVALMGVGMMHVKFNGTSLANILADALKEFITNNPAAFAMLASGASLIALSKVIPAIDRKHRKMVAHRAQVNAVYNDMAKAETANENNLNAEKFSNPNLSEADIQELGSALCDNENLKQQYFQAVQDPNSLLTRTQKLNILKALKKANELKQDLDKQMAENGMNVPTEETTEKPTTTQATEKPVEEQAETNQQGEQPATNNEIPKTPAVKAFEEQIKQITSINNKKLIEKIQNDPNLSEAEKTDLIEKVHQAASAKAQEMNAAKKAKQAQQTKQAQQAQQAQEATAGA